jgi:hypothetical protein
VKFEAKTVETSKTIPHGVCYSLTLHDKSNHRIIGYDNAHSFKPSSFRYGARKTTWDHIHKREETFPYEFDCAGKLMEDFWNSVNYYLANH